MKVKKLRFGYFWRQSQFMEQVRVSRQQEAIDSLVKAYLEEEALAASSQSSQQQ